MSMASYLSSFHHDDSYLMDEEFFTSLKEKKDE
jgi:hypothetical protein